MGFAIIYVGTMMIVLTYDVSGFRLILDIDDAFDRLLGIINMGTWYDDLRTK